MGNDCSSDRGDSGDSGGSRFESSCRARDACGPGISIESSGSGGFSIESSGSGFSVQNEIPRSTPTNPVTMDVVTPTESTKAASKNKRGVEEISDFDDEHVDQHRSALKRLTPTVNQTSQEGLFARISNMTGNHNQMPRFVIGSRDSPELVHEKTNANHLLDMIEEDAGEYGDTHGPLKDLQNSFLLNKSLNNVERLEQMQNPK